MVLSCPRAFIFTVIAITVSVLSSYAYIITVTAPASASRVICMAGCMVGWLLIVVVRLNSII